MPRLGKKKKKAYTCNLACAAIFHYVEMEQEDSRFMETSFNWLEKKQCGNKQFKLQTI